MDRSGNDRLAGTALARDQHRCLGISNTIDYVEDPPHSVVVSDNVLHSKTDVELGLEVLVLFNHLLLIQGTLNRHFQLIVNEWFREEIKRSRTNGINCRVNSSISGDHNDRRIRVPLPALFQQLEAVAIGQTHVDKRRAVIPAGNRSPCLLAILGGIEFVSLTSQPVCHGSENLAIVIY